jgi:hypothetical protein
MNRTDYLVLVVVAFLLSSIFWISSFQKRDRWFDCSLAEISPDYPIEVKQACIAQRTKT